MELKDMKKDQLLDHIAQLDKEIAAAKAVTTDEVVTGLRHELQVANNSVQALESTGTALNASNSTLVYEKAELQATISQLNTDLDDQTDRIGELEGIIRELNGRSIAENKANTPGHQVGELDGAHYRVLCGADVNGVKMSAAEIAANPQALAHLVSIGSGIILPG